MVPPPNDPIATPAIAPLDKPLGGVAVLSVDGGDVLEPDAVDALVDVLEEIPFVLAEDAELVGEFVVEDEAFDAEADADEAAAEEGTVEEAAAEEAATAATAV